MSLFFQKLRAINPPKPSQYRCVYVPYDQLTDRIGPLSQLPPEQTVIIMVETSWKGNRRNYHKQKLAMILSNSRHFALEQAQRGVHVIYRIGRRSYAEELRDVLRMEGIDCFSVMQPAERELRHDLELLTEDGSIDILPHEGWLSSDSTYFRNNPKPPWKMALFYQQLRKQTGYLMEDGAPIGGKYSFDAENRSPWKGDPEAPESPRFVIDDITKEVVMLIEDCYAQHWGQLDPEAIPCTQQHATQLWEWAKSACMIYFGPYEDAMSSASKSLFHTKISTLLNLHRLLPKEILEDVLSMDIPINSKEGFLRQILGWREFMFQVHIRTDGLRSLPISTPTDSDGTVNALSAENPLFPAFWGTQSGLFCLDTVVGQVKEEGYTHHIPRLMILANIATLMHIRPREITDWFWEAFTDAFEWVVEPNVLGMGTFATGELFTTKPYVSGANYIHKMSDYCKSCSLHPKKSCPITRWYWHFLECHQHQFAHNFRMKMILRSLAKRSPEQKELDRKVYTYSLGQLERGEKIVVKDILSILGGL